MTTGKHHVIVEFDDVEIWADVAEPIVDDMRRIHAARSLMKPELPTVVARLRAWYEEHREQSDRCARRECDHYAT